MDAHQPFARLRSQSGFTLIELLVVVLIIGILIAVSAPAFLGQTKKAQDSAAKQTLGVSYKAARSESVFNSPQGSWGTAASLASGMQKDEPELNFSVYAPSIAAKDVQVSLSGTTLSLTALSASGNVCSLSAAQNAALVGPTCAAAAPSAVTTGQGHSCDVYSDATVKCWGDPDGGSVLKSPVLVSGLSGVSQLSAGNYYSCAVVAGAVKCWGTNSNGSLGDGTTSSRPSPVSALGITTAVQVATSIDDSTSCALLADTTVKCWGGGYEGEMGNGTSGAGASVNSTPVTVPGLSGVTQISIEFEHVCAVMADTTVKCWGNNSNGQIGTGSAGANVLTPTAVSGLSGVVQVSTGDSYSCALLSSGAVKCWGDASSGELGNGASTGNVLSPTANGISNATQISSGIDHSCAVLSDGSVKCWGDNSNGEVGTGTAGGNVLTPTAVTGLAGAAQVAAGGLHSCAYLTGGIVECWGYNGEGQLGDGTTTQRPAPVTTG